MSYAQAVAKDVTLTIRLEASERAALERAGKDEDRAASYMARRAIVTMLRASGHLPAVESELARREGEKDK